MNKKMNTKRDILIILTSLLPYLIIFAGIHLLKNAFAALLCYNTVILIIYFYLRKEKINKAILKIKSRFISAILFFLCALSGFIVILLFNYIKIDNLNLAGELQIFGLNGVSKYIFIVLFSVVNPITEELFWRALDNSNKYLNFIRDILFAGYHLIFLVLVVKLLYAVFAVIILIVISRIWRHILRKKEDLLTVIVSHAIADLSIISTILILK